LASYGLASPSSLDAEAFVLQHRRANNLLFLADALFARMETKRRDSKGMTTLSGAYQTDSAVDGIQVPILNPMK